MGNVTDKQQMVQVLIKTMKFGDRGYSWLAGDPYEWHGWINGGRGYREVAEDTDKRERLYSQRQKTVPFCISKLVGEDTNH